MKIAVLPGDGIGVEVTMEARKVLEKACKVFKMKVGFEEFPIGGASLDKYGFPLTTVNLGKIKKCDAVLLGAVGGPKWDTLAYARRPERALLALRKGLGAFANLRPAKVYPALLDASSLKREVVEGVDIMVVRELTGGIYFGKPRGITKKAGMETGFNTEIYNTREIERIAVCAFELARARRKKVTSVDKANILESSELWRRTVGQVHKKYPDIDLGHMYVDNCAMQIVRWPKQFDVIVTNNLFGDILSDEAAMASGSIGLLPSASIAWGRGAAKGIYEPVHGTAPDIAGKGIANPLAAILSVAMMLRFTFKSDEAADLVEKAVNDVLEAGYRTADIAKKGEKVVGTIEMGKAVLEKIGD